MRKKIKKNILSIILILSLFALALFLSTFTACENNTVYEDIAAFYRGTATSSASSSSVSSIPYTPDPSSSTDTWTPGDGWTLTWSDEFEPGSSLGTNWNRQVVDPLTYNNEWQRYTASNENAYIMESNDNGFLVIRAVHLDNSYGAGHFTSARLNTAGKQTFEHGKIAARIQLPYSQGIWPAFWMLGANCNENGGTVPWPYCGEIDIMEMVGTYENRAYAAAHWYSGGHKYNTGSTTLSSGILADDFHVFEIEWNSTTLTWKMDGNTIHTLDITSSAMTELHNDFFILLNIAVGGNWPGYPNSTSVFPQYMYVDWVRAYTEE